MWVLDVTKELAADKFDKKLNTWLNVFFVSTCGLLIAGDARLE